MKYIGLMIAMSLALSACTVVDRMEDRNYLFGRKDALVKPGETFLSLSGGACLGTCPAYEIYLFESGRVIFNGREFTTTRGVVESRVDPAAYGELAKILDAHYAFARRLRIHCMTDHPNFNVFSSRAGRVRSATLDYGCRGHRPDLEAIEAAFVRISRSEALIGKGGS